LAEECDLDLEYPTKGLWEGSDVYVAFEKKHDNGQMLDSSKRRPMFNFSPPVCSLSDLPRDDI
jgi:hypothetical protein